MRVRVGLAGFDVSNACLVETATVQQDSTEAISTCQLTLFQAYGVSRYDTAVYSHAAFVYEWTVEEWQEIVVWDQDGGQLLFAGYIISVQRKQEAQHVRYELSCSDWGILFERALITQSWPEGTLDSTIVEDCIRLVPGLSVGTVVPQVAVGALDAKDQRIRDVLDAVCQLTGGEWNVSYDAKVNYYRQGSIVAPFILCDRPENPNEVPYQLNDYGSDFSDAANRVLVLGAITDTGEIRATANHGASQNQYGLLSITLVDRNLADQATADVWAQTEVATRAYPKPTVNVSLFEPGLSRGMTVEIEADKYGLSATLILRTLIIVIAAPDRTRATIAGHVIKYTATLGWRPPDLVYTLRRMQRKPVQSTIAPSTPVPPGSITADDFASSIEPVHVVSSLPALPDPDYSASAIALWTGAPGGPQLYRRTGNSWTAYVNAADIQGQLQTSQLAPGSVTTTVLADGSVVTAKIPAGAIQAPQLAASSVTANAVAANAIYAQALQANSVTAIALAANSVIAGKIAALAVVAGNIAADAVIAGTIAAGAVRAGNLAAGAVTAGTIAVGAIRAQDAVFQTGAIQSADIQSLSGDKIIAHTITADKLSAVELAIGYGGDKPGRIGVYAQQGLFALIGDMSAAGVQGLWGIWARVAAFGGTGYQDSKMYTDVFGNLFLRNVSLTITAADLSTIVTSPTTFDNSYPNALAITITQPGDSQSSVVSRGLVLRNSSSSVIGAFVRSPGGQYSELTLYSAGLTRTCLIDGSTGNVSVHGLVLADGEVHASGFAVTGTPSFDGTVPAGRAIVVKKGLVTGYV
jgi:hypothetical protein